MARAPGGWRREKEWDAAVDDAAGEKNKEKNHEGLLNFNNVKRHKNYFHRKMKVPFLHFEKITLVEVWKID